MCDFFLQACSVFYLCLGRLQAVVLGLLRCCPSLFPQEKHAVLESYIYHWLCSPSQAVPFPNIWTDLQQDTAFMFRSRGATLSKGREHPSVGAFFSPLSCLCCQMCFWRKIISQKRSSQPSLCTRHLQGLKEMLQNFPKPNIAAGQ